MSPADAVLLVGYLMAVPFTLFVPGFLRLWRRREPSIFVTAQTGALLIAMGWALKDNVPSAVFNGLWFTGLSAAWWLEGRKREGRKRGQREGRKGKGRRRADRDPQARRDPARTTQT